MTMFDKLKLTERDSNAGNASGASGDYREVAAAYRELAGTPTPCRNSGGDAA
jgi:hypothetical protein